jgi:ribosome modulation factor
MTSNDPYGKGYDAGERGITIDSNPYTIGTDDFEQWENGWYEGNIGDDDEMGAIFPDNLDDTHFDEGDFK